MSEAFRPNQRLSIENNLTRNHSESSQLKSQPIILFLSSIVNSLKFIWSSTINGFKSGFKKGWRDGRRK